ncbi:MAG: ElyC/SanA/YdcF family protein [bacterium]
MEYLSRRRQLKRIVSWKISLRSIISWKAISKFVTLVLIAIIIAPLTVFLTIKHEYQPQIYYNLKDVPTEKVAIVFGAGLAESGTMPSDILKDRVAAAVDLYNAGKVKKILMTGDNQTPTHDEPKIMVDYAKSLGVREFDLISDMYGVRTYDSCYRARAIYNIDEAILITQSFHLPRALYFCSSFGIKVIGYSADRNVYQDINYLNFREFFATIYAFWNVAVLAPPVYLGDKG